MDMASHPIRLRVSQNRLQDKECFQLKGLIENIFETK